MLKDDSFRKIIVDEINLAVKMMKEKRDAAQKLYYFSAVHGILHRIFNLEYDSELVYAHFVLRSTHEAFLNRVNAIQKAGDTTILISDEQFEILSSYTKEFASKIKKKEEIDSILKKFVILMYSTTGNGYYLMQKGMLKILKTGID